MAIKKDAKVVWDYECAVIGGGPGGLISALYLTRFKRSTVLINTGIPRAAWGPKVNNLIGYNKGISGRALLRRIRLQIDAIGTLQRMSGSAKVVKRSHGGFDIEIEGKKTITAQTVILATGIEDAHPAIPNLTLLRKLGRLKYCSICDGYENSGSRIAVLANDDFGIRKAIFIGNWTKRITILIPSDLKLAPQRIVETKKLGAQIVRCDDFRITEEGSGVIVAPAGHRPFRATVVYVELGCRVRDEAFKHLRSLRRTKEGFIIATNEQKTSIPGLYAVGDCVNLLGQISVAAGQAAVAATTIHNELI